MKIMSEQLDVNTRPEKQLSQDSNNTINVANDQNIDDKLNRILKNGSSGASDDKVKKESPFIDHENPDKVEDNDEEDDETNIIPLSDYPFQDFVNNNQEEDSSSLKDIIIAKEEIAFSSSEVSKDSITTRIVPENSNNNASSTQSDSEQASASLTKVSNDNSQQEACKQNLENPLITIKDIPKGNYLITQEGLFTRRCSSNLLTDIGLTKELEKASKLQITVRNIEACSDDDDEEEGVVLGYLDCENSTGNGRRMKIGEEKKKILQLISIYNKHSNVVDEPFKVTIMHEVLRPVYTVQ